MLTIKNYNTITMQTIELSNKDLYQIDYINEYEKYYKIGLSNPFKGIGYQLILNREYQMKGPLSDSPYYRLESPLWKHHILIRYDDIKVKTRFYEGIIELLDAIKND